MLISNGDCCEAERSASRDDLLARGGRPSRYGRSLRPVRLPFSFRYYYMIIMLAMVTMAAMVMIVDE